MLRLSKKAEYALMAVKDLASRPESEAASAREIEHPQADRDEGHGGPQIGLLQDEEHRHAHER